VHGVLHVIHGHGGGTEHHARFLIDSTRTRYRHYLAFALGDAWRVEEQRADGVVRTFDRVRAEGEPWPRFVGSLCEQLAVDLVHLHNISGCRSGIISALATLDVPYGYTVHDLSFACPTILFLGVDGKYCHQQTDPAVCAACLRQQPAFAHIDISDWRAQHRALLARSAFLIAPSRFAASALARYYPHHPIAVVSHAAKASGWALQSAECPSSETPREVDEGASSETPSVRSFSLAVPEDGVPTVAVLGAVGPDKGARRLERLAELVRAGGARLRFVLIGYMDVEHGPWQSDDAVLTIHGHYAPRDLPALLAHYRAQIVAFPSAGPETFSFTLSEAWQAGLPVIVPPFGALGERVADAGAGWLWTDDEWSDEAKMLARIAQILAPANAAAVARMSDRAGAVTLSAPESMVESTLRIYEDAIDAARQAVPTANGARDPTAPAVGAPSLPMGTNVRRVLDRLTPAALRKLLKARAR